MNNRKDPTPAPDQKSKPKEIPPPPPSSQPKPDEGLTIRIDPQILLQSAIDQDRGIETIERLVALAKDVREYQARDAWNAAMSEFQRNAPKILKTEVAEITTKKGKTYSYRYAPLEGIMETILPLLGPLGLSVSWKHRFDAGNVITACRISHVMGHFEESGEICIPIEKGDWGATPPQRVGIALTYSKRYSLLAGLGLAPEDDPDARKDDGGKGKEGFQKPERQSESITVPDRPGNVWGGTIGEITSRSGFTGGKEWTLFLIKGTDGVEFRTFDVGMTNFAREAGKLPVWIEYQEDSRGRLMVSIGPANEDPPPPAD